MRYSFSYCLMDGMPGLTRFYPSGREQLVGLRTEGAVRLLSGIPIHIDPADKAKLPEGYNTQDSDPVDPFSIHEIIWSPLGDSWTPYLGLAKCTDGSLYPICSAEVREACGYYDSRVLITELRCFWREFIRLTEHIPKRALVLSNPELLREGRFKDHVSRIQDEAVKLWTAHGWVAFTPDPELADDGYWAHHSQRAKAKIHDEVGRFFEA